MNGSESNGKKQGENVMSLEMEQLHPEPTTVRYPQKLSLLDQIFLLFKLYMESYPRIASFVGFVVFTFCIYAAVVYSQPPLARNQLEHTYTAFDEKIDRDFSGKVSQMDHWCLFGDDEACSCEDFTDPMPREEVTGWLEVHEKNKQRIVENEWHMAEYDMVFYGDDLIENLNGYAYNRPIAHSDTISNYFKEQFTFENEESSINSIALGITGDSSANMLWRLQHGEMPDNMSVNVFWLALGTSDLARGGCSEDAVVLGILRVAEEIHKEYPMAVVVIQGILPRTSRKDGLLEPRSYHKHLLGKHHTEKYYANMARNAFLLWPSIQVINKQLEEFCEDHEYFVYFDAAAMFLKEVKDPKVGKTYKIMQDLMSDYVHPSPKGWKLLGKAIRDEYDRIVLDENDENDIEGDDD